MFWLIFNSPERVNVQPTPPPESWTLEFVFSGLTSVQQALLEVGVHPNSLSIIDEDERTDTVIGFNVSKNPDVIKDVADLVLRNSGEDVRKHLTRIALFSSDRNQYSAMETNGDTRLYGSDD